MSNASKFTTDKEIKAAEPLSKEYVLSDTKTTGLGLRISPNGKKQWIFRYSSPTIKQVVKNRGKESLKGKRRTKGIGMYPTIPLSDARIKANDYIAQIAKGIDPIEVELEIKNMQIAEKARDKAQIHTVFYEWIESLKTKGLSDGTIKRKISLFENALFPYLDAKRDDQGTITSSKHINDITHPEILKAVNEKQKSANEMARRLLGDCKTLWDYAIAYGQADKNIIDIIPQNERPKKIVKHYAKITDEKILGHLTNDLEAYSGHPITKYALQLLPYVMLRAENLTQLRWEYIDFKNAVLTIPRNKMKVKDHNLSDFKLPLTKRAIEVLKEIQHYTKDTPWVFHAINNSSKPLDPAVINKALKISLGYNNETLGTKQTIHSFRGTFSSLAYQHQQEHKQYEVVIERLLDHQERNETVAAYSHKANYLTPMRDLLNWWEAYLQRLKDAVS